METRSCEALASASPSTRTRSLRISSPTVCRSVSTVFSMPIRSFANRPLLDDRLLLAEGHLDRVLTDRALARAAVDRLPDDPRLLLADLDRQLDLLGLVVIPVARRHRVGLPRAVRHAVILVMYGTLHLSPAKTNV
jgi:hypothetical protein